MKLLPAVLWLFALFSQEVWGTEEIWKRGEAFLPMSNNRSQNWLISLHCERAACQAKSALKNVSFKSLSSSMLVGGKNPGAVLCHQMPQAMVVFMQDLQGNQNSFCKFADGSMVSSSTLVMYANKNDKK